MKFNADRFSRTWVGLRVSRWLKDNIFDPLGHDNLRYLIETNQSFVKRIPSDYIKQYAQKIPMEELAKFTREQLYNWIPEEYRKIIESMPNGKEWAVREMELFNITLLAYKA